MSVPALPEFDQMLAVASETLDAGELAECHGAACGLLCRHPYSGPDAFIRLLADLELLRDPELDLADGMQELYRTSAMQLEDEQLRLALWMPDDDEPLEARTRALAHWCTGFLAGLGSGHDKSLDSLSEEVEGALSDLQQIAQADVVGDGDPEEEEAALMELIEYVRVVTMMMKQELSPPAAQDLVH